MTKHSKIMKGYPKRRISNLNVEYGYTVK